VSRLFVVEIERVQPVRQLRFEVDLDESGVLCITGKNGAGKTTLARAIMNFASADTFARTASEGIFDAGSKVVYTLDGERFEFLYDPSLNTINTRHPVPQRLKRLVSVELPMPHGQRFNFFRTLRDVDHDVRRRIILGEYERPDRLIEFLSSIYAEQRFDDLISVEFRGGTCCCTLRGDRYLREDYFSSGEYFLINLYRKINAGTPLVFIDEIDISLDASAQARLGAELRLLCRERGVKVVFTSHSLAIMQTLEPGELLYLERHAESSSLSPMAFNFVKSLMFGFTGYDRFILTEDVVLKELLEYVIRRYCPPTFFAYAIIMAGGAMQVVEMMRRNRREKFLGRDQDVIAILDGDARRSNAARGEHYIPIQNVEAALLELYREPGFPIRVPEGERMPAKTLYAALIRTRRLSAEEILKLVCDRHDAAMREFAQLLTSFLSRPGGGVPSVLPQSENRSMLTRWWSDLRAWLRRYRSKSSKSHT
jgi:predicted ATPase